MRERHRHSVTPAIKVSITGLLLLVGLFVIPQFSFAAICNFQGVPTGFCESPGVTPLVGAPGSSPTFLNGSSATQTKLGSFLIGPPGGSAVLCLNSDTSKSIHDASNTATCIDSWVDVTSAGFYVRRQQNTTPSNPLDPSTYGTADRGFATVIAKGAPYNQGLSTVVKVNTASTAPVRYAVYATDSGVNTRGAAQLSGKTYISKSGQGNAVLSDLCLNGQCIQQWSGAFLFGNAGIIRLQNTSTLISDIGNASVSGATQFSRGLTIGRPSAITSPTWTYGDGQCTSENGEDSSNSPNDCN